MTAALRIEAERAAERKKKEGELNLLEGTVAAAAVEEPLFSLFDEAPNEAHLPQKKKDVDFHQPLDQSMIYHRQQPQVRSLHEIFFSSLNLLKLTNSSNRGVRLTKKQTQF